MTILDREGVALALAACVVALVACRRSSSAAHESIEQEPSPSKSSTKAHESASASSSAPAAPSDSNVTVLSAKEIAHGVSPRLPRTVAGPRGEPALIYGYGSCAWARVDGATTTPIGSWKVADGSCLEDPAGRIAGNVWGTIDGPSGVQLQAEITSVGSGVVFENARIVVPWSDGRVVVGEVGGVPTFDGDTTGPMLDLDGLSCPEGVDARARPSTSRVDGSFVLAGLERVPKCDDVHGAYWLWTPKHDGRPMRLPNDIRAWTDAFAAGPDGAVWLGLVVGKDATSERLAFYRVKGDALASQSTPPDADMVSALARGDAGTTWAVVSQTTPRDDAGIQHLLPSRLWFFDDRWRRVVLDDGPAEGFSDVRVIGRDVFIVAAGRLFHAVE
jgi:hypothetical protein